MTAPVKHLSYQIDPSRRDDFHQTNWKICALELLKKHVDPRGKSLLDFGCGRGESMQIFGEAGMQTTGADMDPECVRLASQFGKAVLLENDPVTQFGAKSFDVVACFHVLEHVENPKQTLQQLAAISKEHVLLAVPNLRYLHMLFQRDFNLEMINPGHLQSWDHFHFRNLAERHCGLELVAWGSDATALPLISNLVQKVFGDKLLVRLETGLFKAMFPYHCISVLGLFRVKR